MKEVRIAWITFNAFVDTDLYVIQELKKSYIIDWYVIKSGNDKFEYEKEFIALDKEPNINVFTLQCGRRLRSIECIHFYSRLLKKIENKHYDLIYTSLAGAPYFIPVLIPHRNKCKIIMAIHNVHVPKGGTAYYFFKLYNWLAIHSFKYYQTFSQSQFEYLKTLIPKKEVRYIPFILKDYGNATQKRSSDILTFLNFGNIRRYKRLDVLIQAAQKAYENTNKKIRVIIAGKCEDWEEYQKLIKCSEIFDIRLGRVENEDIPNLFNEADYFVAPYQDIAQSGSAVVAINYSVPIIASKLPAFEEYIVNGRNGYLIEPANEYDLEQLIERLINEPDSEYQKVKQQLERDRDTQFSRESIIKRYKDYIDGIIEKE